MSRYVQIGSVLSIVVGVVLILRRSSLAKRAVESELTFGRSRRNQAKPHDRGGRVAYGESLILFVGAVFVALGAIDLVRRLLAN